MPITIHATVDPIDRRVDARTEQGHRVAMDTDAPDGDATAPEPKEILLAALAGCTSMDVASILEKKRQVATAYEIVVSGTSAGEHPRVFTAITVDHRLSGAIEAEALRRSIELSATHYCPVIAMLSAVATIEHSYRLTAADGTSVAALVAVTGPTGARVL